MEKMKITIVVENKGKFIKIPITKKELFCIYDFNYMICSDCWKTTVLNKIDKPLISFSKKIEFLEQDVVGEGKTYSYKGNKLILDKERYYFVKKPIWKIRMSDSIK
jgi:hypothetical protein